MAAESKEHPKPIEIVPADRDRHPVANLEGREEKLEAPLVSDVRKVAALEAGARLELERLRFDVAGRRLEVLVLCLELEQANGGDASRPWTIPKRSGRLADIVATDEPYLGIEVRTDQDVICVEAV